MFCENRTLNSHDAYPGKTLDPALSHQPALPLLISHHLIHSERIIHS